jgi:hypothetical protein
LRRADDHSAGRRRRRRLWQRFTLRGTTPGHAEAGEISRNVLRAILESAHGIKPDDTSEAAKAARRPSGWGDFDQLRFIAMIGVQPPKNNYRAKNTIMEVIKPDRQTWRKLEQVAKPPNNAAPAMAAAPPVPASAITRPQWAD